MLVSFVLPAAFSLFLVQVVTVPISSVQSYLLSTTHSPLLISFPAAHPPRPARGLMAAAQVLALLDTSHSLTHCPTARSGLASSTSTSLLSWPWLPVKPPPYFAASQPSSSVSVCGRPCLSRVSKNAEHTEGDTWSHGLCPQEAADSFRSLL